MALKYWKAAFKQHQRQAEVEICKQQLGFESGKNTSHSPQLQMISPLVFLILGCFQTSNVLSNVAVENLVDNWWQLINKTLDINQ